jgi:GNAT superfamily N-acetyltransferase
MSSNICIARRDEVYEAPYNLYCSLGHGRRHILLQRNELTSPLPHSMRPLPERTTSNTMADTPPHFHIRPGSLDSDDVDFVLAAWDSTLPFLASIGAGEMWGSQPFRQRQGQKQEIIDIITGTLREHDGGRQLWIAETERDVKVGAAMTREVLPGYLLEHVDLEKHIDTSRKLLYLEVLITDHRHNKQSRGAGKALVEALKQHARSDGRDVLYVDVWAGNNRKLNK